MQYIETDQNILHALKSKHLAFKILNINVYLILFHASACLIEFLTTREVWRARKKETSVDWLKNVRGRNEGYVWKINHRFTKIKKLFQLCEFYFLSRVFVHFFAFLNSI